MRLISSEVLVDGGFYPPVQDYSPDPVLPSPVVALPVFPLNGPPKPLPIPTLPAPIPFPTLPTTATVDPIAVRNPIILSETVDNLGGGYPLPVPQDKVPALNLARNEATIREGGNPSATSPGVQPSGGTSAAATSAAADAKVVQLLIAAAALFVLFR